MKEEIVWDRTNIGENYPGVTLPLTYTFIKDAYRNVYLNFLKKLDFNTDLIQHHMPILDNMLGYVNGHIFYNIENWYSFIKLLPGYKYNKKFFEDMLDPVVKKKVDSSNKSTVDIFVKVSSLSRFIYTLVFFNQTLLAEFDKKFHKLEEKYKKEDLQKLSNSDLIFFFNTTQDQFFKIWANTIFNDFKVMIFFGLLKKYSQKFGKSSEKILRDLYSIKNQPRSIVPLVKLVQLALLIKQDKKTLQFFSYSRAKILEYMQQKTLDSSTEIRHQFNLYLSQYGERSSNELKLEEPKLKDKPALFVDLLKNYCSLSEKELGELLLNAQAKKESYIPSSASTIDRLIILILKKITVNGIYVREYFRMKRGKAFGIAREIFLEIGARMVKNQDLSDKEDIFYLHKQEIFDYIQFQNVVSDFKKVVVERKQQIKLYKEIKMPRRIKTSQMPDNKVFLETKHASKIILKGQVTSRGKVSAQVIVMESLDLTADFKNKILVTSATDPGWTVIFPLLRGVITEQGGTLSHASIIAREINIPCIVQVENATTALRSGQKVDMDAIKGTVKIIN